MPDPTPTETPAPILVPAASNQSSFSDSIGGLIDNEFNKTAKTPSNETQTPITKEGGEPAASTKPAATNDGGGDQDASTGDSDNPILRSLAKGTQDAETGTAASEEVALPKTGKEMRLKLKELDSQLKEAKTKLAEYEGKVKSGEEASKGLEPLKKQLQEKESKIAEYEKALSIVQVEATETFQKQFGKPIAELESKITDLSKAYEIEPREILDTLQITDPKERLRKLKDVTSGLDPVDTVEIKNLLDQFDSLKKGAETIRANAKTALAEIQKDQQAKLQADRDRWAKDSEHGFESAFKELQKAAPIFNPIEGNEEHNKWIGDLLQAAKEIDRNPQAITDHVQRGKLIQQGLAFPRVLSTYADAVQQLHAENQALKKKIGSYTQSSPGLGASEVAGRETTPAKEMDWNTAVAEMASKLRG